MHDFAVYIGRFQPFHNAHFETVKFGLQQAKRLLVVIGSDHQARTIKNPWTTDERIAMVSNALSREELSRVTFVPVKDHRYNDNLWIAAVQQAISEATAADDDDETPTKDRDIVLVGNPKDASSFYLRLFPQWTFVQAPLISISTSVVNATKIRTLMFSLDKIGIKHMLPVSVYEAVIGFMETDEFKRLHEEYHHILAYKSAWDGAPFPPTFNTVDAVCVCSGHVLVVRRRASPGRGLIALPGGFIKQDELLVDACLRELKEETAIKMHPQELKKLIASEKVFDHPTRSLRGRTITHAFCINLGRSELPRVKGEDDADKAWWMPLNDVYVKEAEFFDDHFHIINYFINRF